MKFRNIVLIAVALPLFAFGQAAPVSVSPADKIAIEKAQAGLTLLQAQGAAAQNEYNAKVASLSWNFEQQNAAYNALLVATKKRLGLPPEAVFNAGSFSFTVPAPAPAPPTLNTPLKTIPVTPANAAPKK